MRVPVHHVPWAGLSLRNENGGGETLQIFLSRHTAHAARQKRKRYRGYINIGQITANLKKKKPKNIFFKWGLHNMNKVFIIFSLSVKYPFLSCVPRFGPKLFVCPTSQTMTANSNLKISIYKSLYRGRGIEEVAMKLLPPGFIFAGGSRGRPLSLVRLAALVAAQLTLGASQLVLAGIYGEDCPSMSSSIVLSGAMFMLLGLFVAAAGYATQRMEGADSSIATVRTTHHLANYHWRMVVVFRRAGSHDCHCVLRLLACDKPLRQRFGKPSNDNH